MGDVVPVASLLNFEGRNAHIHTSQSPPIVRVQELVSANTWDSQNLKRRQDTASPSLSADFADKRDYVGIGVVCCGGCRVDSVALWGLGSHRIQEGQDGSGAHGCTFQIPGLQLR